MHNLPCFHGWTGEKSTIILWNVFYLTSVWHGLYGVLYYVHVCMFVCMLSHSNSELCSFSGLYFVFISASLWPNVVVFSFFLAHEEIVYKMFCQKHLSAIQCHSSGAVTPLNHIYLHINVANNLHTTTHTQIYSHPMCKYKCVWTSKNMLHSGGFFCFIFYFWRWALGYTHNSQHKLTIQQLYMLGRCFCFCWNLHTLIITYPLWEYHLV